MAKKYQKKKSVKKKSNRKRVEMIRLSQGSSTCQAITPIYHQDDSVNMTNFTLRIPDKIYYRLTSSDNISDPTVHEVPNLAQRISGNSCFSKYLNYRFRIEFDNLEAYQPCVRTRVIAGTFKDAPNHAPWNGWTSDQVGTPNSPEICDTDFDGVSYADNMTEALASFYSGDLLWGGLLEKARWDICYDKTFDRSPTTGAATAVQTFTGNTPAWTAGFVGGGDRDPPYSTVSSAPGLNAGAVIREEKYTRKPVEGFIDFSKKKCCNKKLYYGPNVDSSKANDSDLNISRVNRPDDGGLDRTLASTTARDIPFVLILQPDFDDYKTVGTLGVVDRWCHYFQDE